jgi:hypothetical protein
LPGQRRASRARVRAAAALAFGRAAAHPGTSGRRFGPAEKVRPEFEVLPVQPQLAHGILEAHPDQLCEHPFAFHPAEEAWVVVPAVSQVLDPMHDPAGPVGKMRLQPLLEQRIDFKRQTDDGVVRAARPRVLGVVQ